MVWILEILWLIPALPLAAAAVAALARRPQHRFAATLAIGSMILAFVLSCVAFVSTLGGHTGMEVERQVYNFDWLQFGDAWLKLGWLSSYLLIGFWHHKPSAAAAANKAFIVTRVGDIGFFLGILWLYAKTGTLLFYDNGNGCLEQSALTGLVGQTTSIGLAVSTGISLLIFCGAIGKSGQVPLHVWLPDAMEGPTPVSALIHAATMVAAGVFLIARAYPLMSAHGRIDISLTPTTALTVVTWVGA